MNIWNMLEMFLCFMIRFREPRSIPENGITKLLKCANFWVASDSLFSFHLESLSKPRRELWERRETTFLNITIITVSRPALASTTTSVSAPPHPRAGFLVTWSCFQSYQEPLSEVPTLVLVNGIKCRRKKLNKFFVLLKITKKREISYSDLLAA